MAEANIPAEEEKRPFASKLNRGRERLVEPERDRDIRAVGHEVEEKVRRDAKPVGSVTVVSTPIGFNTTQRSSTA